MADNSVQIVLTAADKATPALQKVGAEMLSLGKAAELVKGQLAAVGAGVTVAGFAGLIADTVKAAAALHDLSMQTGVSVEALSGLKSVAALSDTSMDQVAGGAQKLVKNMTAAATGSKDAAAVFEALGVSVTNSSGGLRDAGDTYQDVAKSIASLQSPTERVAAAQLVFGKNGAQLIPMLMDMAAAGDLVVKTTTEQAALADNIGDNWKRLGMIYQGTAKTIALEALPALDAFTETMLEQAKGTNGLKNAVGDLKNDGSLKEWAIGAAKAAGFVMDAFDGVQRVFQIAGRALAGIAKDVVTANEILKVGVTGALTEAGRKQIKQLVAERQAFMAEMNRDIDAIANKALFSTTLAQKLENLGKDKPGEQKVDTGNSLAKRLREQKAREEAAKGVDEAILKSRMDLLAAVRKLEIDAAKEIGESTYVEQLASIERVKQAKLAALREEYETELAAYKKLPAGAEKEKLWGKLAVKAVEMASAFQDAGQAVDTLNRKIGDEAKKSADQWVASLDKSVDALQKEIDKQREHNDAIGKSKEAVAELAASRLENVAAADDEYAANIRNAAQAAGDLHDAYLQAADAIEQTAKKRRELAGAMREGGEKEALAEAAKEAEKEWRRVSESIESSITDALMRGFESGKDFAANFRDVLKNMFKTLILQPIVKFGVQGLLGSIGLGGLAGVANASGVASDAGSLLGGANGLGQAAQIGRTMWDAFSGGMTAPGSSFFNFATGGIGQALGLGTASTLGGASAGIVSSATAAGATGIEAAMAGGALNGVSAGLTGLGSAIGAALPWIGLATAAFSLFGGKRGGPKFEGAQGFNLSTGAAFDDARLPDGLRGYTGNSADAQIEQLMKPVIAGLGTTIAAFGGKLAGDAQARFSMVRDPKGTADSFVGSDLFIGGKKVFGANNNYGRSDEDFQRGVETESKRLTLASIAFGEGIDPIVQALLRGSNLATASLSELDALMAKATSADAFTNTIDKLRGGFSDLDVAFSDLLVGPAKDAFNLSLQDIGSFVTDAVTNITPDAATLNRISVGFDEAGNEVFVTLGESITNAATTALSTGTIDVDAVRASIKKGLAPVFQDLIGNFDITSASAEDTAKLNSKLQQTEMLRKVFDSLGFGINNVTAAAVNGANNLQTFASNSAAYYQAITSPQKQIEDSMRSLGAQFGNFGLTMPTTLEGFTALVDGIDKTTPAGMRMFEMLMSLFPAFQQVTNAAEELRRKQKELAEQNYQNALELARGNMSTQQLAGQLRGETPLQQAQRAQSLAANQVQSSLMRLGKGFMSLSDILAMSEGEMDAWLNSLDKPTRQLVNSWLQASQTVQQATEQMARATADKISEIRAATMGGIGNTQTGPTWFDAGTMKGIWAEQFGQWFGTAGEAMNRGGLDFGTSTERMIAMMRAELARQNARLGTEGVDQYGNHPAELAMQVLQENIASLLGDLAKYQSYESQYSGKGKQLLELDKWRDGMLANAKGNQDAINAVLASYNEQFRKIVEGATEAAATASTAWADFKQSISDSLADIGLNDMERKIKSINDAYLDNLKKAQEAAKASGFGPGLTQEAQAKVDTLAGKGLNIRDTLDAKRAALLEAERQQREQQATGSLGNGELAQRIAALRSEIAALTSDYTANQAALTAAREKLASLTAGSREYAEALLNVEKLQAAQIAKLKAEFMAPISEALSTFDMSAYEKQIYEINKAYEKNMESARALGLTLNDLSQIESLRNKQLKKAAEDNLRSTYEAYKAHLEGIIAAKKTAEDSLRSAYQQRAGEYQATIDKVKDAESALRTAYESKVSEIDATQKKFADFAESIKEFRQSLTQGENGVLSAAERYRSAFDLMNETIARAKGGDETAFGKLQGQASDALGQAKNQASTRLDYLRDFARVDAALQDAEAAARGQSSVAEQQLAALKLQYNWLDTKGDQSLDAALKTYEQAKLAGKVAQEQLDALKKQVGSLISLDESTKSIEELIDEYLTASAAANLAQKQLEELQKQVGALINIDASINAQGAAMAAAVAAAIASLGSLMNRPIDAGTNWGQGGKREIIETGGYDPEPIDTGGYDPQPVAAAVETAQLMARLMQPQQDNKAMVAAIERLEETVKAGNSAIAQTSRDTARVLTKWDGDGQPEVRT